VAAGGGGLFRNAFANRVTAITLDPSGSELCFSDDGALANTTVTRHINFTNQRIDRKAPASRS
jgi:hypothetical protein